MYENCSGVFIDSLHDWFVFFVAAADEACHSILLVYVIQTVALDPESAGLFLVTNADCDAAADVSNPHLRRIAQLHVAGFLEDATLFERPLN